MQLTCHYYEEKKSAGLKSICTPNISALNLPLPMVNDAPTPCNAPATVTTTSTSVDEEKEYSDDGFRIKYNCDQIRAKIRQFLGTKEMTLKKFLKECQVKAGPYYRFMDVNGPARGAGNSTFVGASRIFYHRERRAKIDNKKQKANGKKCKTSEEREEKAKRAKDGLDLLERIEETELEEEGGYGYPPVYDDCDDIRKKISEFLGEKIVTQTAFLKALVNVVYRKGYVFFEKKRILEGGKKTKKRLENEGPEGFELRHDDGKRYY